MASAAWLIGFPLVGFLTIVITPIRRNKNLISLMGVLGIALSSILSIYLFCQSLVTNASRQLMWTLLPDLGFGLSSIEIAFYLDPLSVVMCLVVTFISLLIALYSSEYMEHEEGLGRFFAGINLFVAAMLILVLADNLFVL